MPEQQLDLEGFKNLQGLLYYSVRNDLTGFATAAFTAWKLTVINAISITRNAAPAKSHQLCVMR